MNFIALNQKSFIDKPLHERIEIKGRIEQTIAFQAWKNYVYLGIPFERVLTKNQIGTMIHRERELNLGKLPLSLY